MFQFELDQIWRKFSTKHDSERKLYLDQVKLIFDGSRRTSSREKLARVPMKLK